MALAMLASRNEPYWGDPKVYMSSSRKTPNPKILPNPNPSSSNKRYEQNPTIEPADSRLASSSAAGAGAAAAAASDDDSSSLKPPPLDLGRRREAGAYVTYKISNYSKKELRELKRRLICELDLVRSVASRIEAREQQLAAGGRSSAASSKKIPVRSETAIRPKKPPPPRPSAEITKLTSAMMKRCGQILTKLTKHAGAVWFNSPVDVVALNLPDYHRIIKNPMDLGTVKSKLNKNLYSTPSDLAADIRLTFNNALTYNPPGHVVYNIAQQLLAQFETSFGPAYHKYEKHLASISRKDEDEEEDDEEEEEEGWRPRDISSWSQQPQQAPLPEINKLCVEPPTPVAPPSHPIDNRPSPVAVPSSKHHQQMTTTKPMGSGKQPPKPKAKDQNKRPMTMDEKEKLTHALQDLPSDKMPQLLLIIQKRNAANLQAGGDEVELDFELMDNETLWELDRFVTNIKKSMSKVRKQQEAMSGQGTGLISAPTSDPTPTPAPLPHHAAGGAFEKSIVAAAEMPGATAAKRSKKLDPEDEDVDIGEDLPVTNYPSVDIEKDTGCHSSSSSSSSSDSSSSSGSDSGSSSGSDSDELHGGAQSPVAAGSRPLPGN